MLTLQKVFSNNNKTEKFLHRSEWVWVDIKNKYGEKHLKIVFGQAISGHDKSEQLPAKKTSNHI